MNEKPKTQWSKRSIDTGSQQHKPAGYNIFPKLFKIDTRFSEEFISYIKLFYL